MLYAPHECLSTIVPAPLGIACVPVKTNPLLAFTLQALLLVQLVLSVVVAMVDGSRRTVVDEGVIAILPNGNGLALDPPNRRRLRGPAYHRCVQLTDDGWVHPNPRLFASSPVPAPHMNVRVLAMLPINPAAALSLTVATEAFAFKWVAPSLGGGVPSWRRSRRRNGGWGGGGLRHLRGDDRETMSVNVTGVGGALLG